MLCLQQLSPDDKMPWTNITHCSSRGFLIHSPIIVLSALYAVIATAVSFMPDGPMIHAFFLYLASYPSCWQDIAPSGSDSPLARSASGLGTTSRVRSRVGREALARGGNRRCERQMSAFPIAAIHGRNQTSPWDQTERLEGLFLIGAVPHQNFPGSHSQNPASAARAPAPRRTSAFDQLRPLHRWQ